MRYHYKGQLFVVISKSRENAGTAKENCNQLVLYRESAYDTTMSMAKVYIENIALQALVGASQRPVMHSEKQNQTFDFYDAPGSLSRESVWIFLTSHLHCRRD